MDFYKIKVKKQKSNNRDTDCIVYPDFKYANVKDLVCKGGSIYAAWMDNHWNTNLDDVIVYVDRDVRKKVEETRSEFPERNVIGKYMDDNETRLMTQFDSYTKLRKQSDVQFNNRIIFSDEQPTREDYSTNQLTFTPAEGPCPAFDELVGLLYSEPELEKILWFIGALFTNNMPKIQKFMFLYGGKGAGKGTIIKIFKMLFEGYHSTIDLMQLTSGSEFATSQIKEVPLLIDDDSDISRITKDTNLLKLTAHEPIQVNVKYKQAYDVIFNGLLITASNQRFQVRNIDSGITRRAIVVMPTSHTHSGEKYYELMDKVKYELPQIAKKSIELFNEKGPYYYEDYMDVAMAEATDYIFSFVRENYVALGDEVTLKKASELFRVYLEDLGYDTKGYKRRIKNELMRYYTNFYPSKKVNGENIRNVFSGFKKELVFPDAELETPAIFKEPELQLKETKSIFDEVCKDYPAQLATSNGTPAKAWDEVTTTLKDIDTSKLHYVRLPLNHIIIDFDKKNEDGEKDLTLNLESAEAFPSTYSEVSKSGNGVHLHYIYNGDVTKLASLYDEDIEIKVYSGKQSLRRQLTVCNDKDIHTIGSGLPMKEREGISVYEEVGFITWNEKKMRTAIKKNLSKEYHNATKPSMDFIAHIFKQAEEDGVKYDLRDMRQDIVVFGAKSSHQAPACLKIANQIKYCTIDQEVDTMEIQKGGKFVDDKDIWFYDIEVYPNLFIFVTKRFEVDEFEVYINQEAISKMETLFEKRAFIGFNNRRYDNHICYAAMLGEDISSLYRQSQRIINDKNAGSGMYSGAYELSYADIYEYSSKKQSLKKWEVDLGIKHDEMELPWDQPVPEELWDRIIEYCKNDVSATEAVFKATYQDYIARKIISELSGLSVNATTTQQTAAFLFGNDPRPQDKFIYTDLSEMFPGYKYEFGKSEYRGEDPGEGGYVYSEPGVYEEVALLDVASMHPTSLEVMDYFGPYTKQYSDLKQARIYIKHEEYDKAGEMFNGALKPYLGSKEDAEALSYALKIVINIVYGMTSAKFDNKFKHPKNVDNIVAKRGALFMINLKHEVQERGFTVAHIKTDSIKIPNATQEIIDFVFDYGKQYGYDFEHEATYSKMALVNKSVYIAQYGWADKENKIGKWEATGAQFADPIVYKKLFTGEEIKEKDYMITKQANSPIYLGEAHVGKIATVYCSKSGEELVRVKDDKRNSVAGTKNFGWRLASDYQGKDDINMEYYDGIVMDALKAIDKVGSARSIVPHIPEEYSSDLLPF